MNTVNEDNALPPIRRARDLLRDPAVWAWVVVALLAILPARDALTHVRGDGDATHRHAIR
jgi:hypothetical protein